MKTGWLDDHKTDWTTLWLSYKTDCASFNFQCYNELVIDSANQVHLAYTGLRPYLECSRSRHVRYLLCYCSKSISLLYRTTGDLKVNVVQYQVQVGVCIKEVNPKNLTNFSQWIIHLSVLNSGEHWYCTYNLRGLSYCRSKSFLHQYFFLEMQDLINFKSIATWTNQGRWWEMVDNDILKKIQAAYLHCG